MTLDDEKVKDLKIQWKKLWAERLVDRQRAEGIATGNYLDLFIDKGTVLHATRDFKILSLKEILKRYQLSTDEFLQPNPSIGGYGVFIKKSITKDQKKSKNAQNNAHHIDTRRKAKPQLKKGGKGWFHYAH